MQPHGDTAAMVAAIRDRGRSRHPAARAQRLARPDSSRRVRDGAGARRAGSTAREIHVFTDGAYTLTRTPDSDRPARLRWVGVGTQGAASVAITNLRRFARAYVRARSTTRPSSRSVNCTAEAPDRSASRWRSSGKTIAEKSVTLEPSVRRSVVLPFSHGGGGYDHGAACNGPTTIWPPTTRRARCCRRRAKIAVLLVSPATCSSRRS